MADYESEEKALVLNTDLSHVLIVDGLPQVTEDKKDKLQTFTKKAFAKFGGKIVEPPGIHFPVENGKTIGLAFMEFEDSETAKMMLGKIDNYRFDTKHTLRANLYSDYQAFSQIKEYIAPVAPVIETKTDLRSWLQDGFLRDQFVIRHSNQTEIFWNDPYRKANDQGRELCYNGSRQTQEQKFWTKLYVAWSPLGSYLATFHKEGIMLWGGRDFQLVARMPHQSVKWIDFSPKETYIVTSNGQDRTADSDDPDCVIVWDIRTGQKKRGFNRGFSPSWPIFKWSFDETYLARVEKDKIMIYETPDMGLLHKKAISAERVHEIQWSPTDYQLSYWIPELGTEAATVALLEIPSKRTLRDIHVHTNSHLCPRRSQTQSDKQQQQQQQQQQVQEKCTVFRPCRDCKVTMHWESQGAFLAVKLVRRKTKKKVQTSFHIVRLGDEKKQKKEIPVEVLDIDEPVCAFAWEPQGTRFGILSGEGTRYTARFYETKGPKLKLIVEVKERACNALFWSPRGNMVILAGLGSLNGQLEFYDVTAKETTAAMEHYMCTDIEWDPSGRFVITSVTQPLKSNTFYRYGSENGYKVWGMYGQVLANVRLDQLYQVMWRPRPKRLLTAEKEKEIKKQLKSRYFDRFVKEDEDIASVIRGDAYESKKKMDEEWKAYREEKIREYADQKEERENLQEATEAELIDMDEVEEEEEIESTTEILQ